MCGINQGAAMTYALHECANCGKVVPANEMKTWTSRVRAGESTNSEGRVVSTQYRFLGKLLCSECYSKALNRRILLIAVVVIAFIGYIIFGAHNNTDSTPNNDTASAPSQAVSAPNDQPVTNAPVAVPDQSVPASGNLPRSSDSPTGAPVNSSPDQSIDTSILSALDSGQATHWRASDGRSGYVTVSQSQNYGVKECKTYQITIDRGQLGDSQPKLACRDTPNREWDVHAVQPGN
jgi:hypothetical protein